MGLEDKKEVGFQGRWGLVVAPLGFFEMKGEELFDAVELGQTAEFGKTPKGFDAGDAGNFMAFELGGERLLAAPIADDGRKLAHDESGDVGPVRLDIERVDAGVADERVGHRDDLAAIGRVGQDFLIAGHRRVETNFPVGGLGRAEGLAAPDAAVFKGEKG